MGKTEQRRLTIVFLADVMGSQMVCMKRITARPGEPTEEAAARHGVTHATLVFDGWPWLEGEDR